jgi:hypothetical protein
MLCSSPQYYRLIGYIVMLLIIYVVIMVSKYTVRVFVVE